MKQTDFNADWKVRRMDADAAWEAVTLPHDAMLSEPRTKHSVGRDNIGWYEAGDYEYEKTFVVTGDEADGKAILEFEGVYHNAEVYLDGEKKAFRPYGYTNFYVDLSEDLTAGEHTLRVVAKNADQPNSRWYSGTGIYRPVWLWTSQKDAYIPTNGIRVRTEDADKGQIAVAVLTSGRGRVRVEITDADGMVVLTEEKRSNGRRALFHLRVPEVKQWSPEHPYCYGITAYFGEDSAHDHFGIRTLRWSAAEGMTINGERVILRGACIHHDHGILGARTFQKAEERRVRLLKEAGYNAIRSAHNPCSKYLLDACDKYGVLIMDEYIDHWYIHKTKYDYVDYMKDWWKQDLKDMVEKDFNHPSVVLYSTGNEVAETSEKRGIAWQRAMTRYLHKLDASRPVTCGVNIFFNFLYSIGMGVYSDDKAEAELLASEEVSEQKAPVGSEFYNMLAVKIGTNFMKFGAWLPPSDWKTKDAYAAMDIAGYNYGIWRYRKDMKKYPHRLIVGTETFCKDAWLFWEIAKENPPIIGDFVWSGMDYIGETGMGAAEYARYDLSDTPETCMTGGNGRIDLTGQLTAEAYYTLVALEQEKGPFLATAPAYEENRKPPITGWQLTKALRSWSYDGADGRKTTVEVYARAAEVAVVLNGREVGRKKVGKTCRVELEVVYESGRLEAIAYDEWGEEIGRDVLVSAGEETILAVEPEETTIRQGDIAFVRLRYTDDDGITKVREQHDIGVSVEGGRLLGLGNACPYYRGNYTDDRSYTYYGEALAVVQADEAADEVVVTVTDETGRSVSAALAAE